MIGFEKFNVLLPTIRPMGVAFETVILASSPHRLTMLPILKCRVVGKPDRDFSGGAGHRNNRQFPLERDEL